VARGEVVVVEDRFGIKLTDLVGGAGSRSEVPLSGA